MQWNAVSPGWRALVAGGPTSLLLARRRHRPRANGQHRGHIFRRSAGHRGRVAAALRAGRSESGHAHAGRIRRVAGRGQGDGRGARPLAGRRDCARPAPEPRPHPAGLGAAERARPADGATPGAASHRDRRRIHRGGADRPGRLRAEDSRTQPHHRAVPGGGFPRLPDAEPHQRSRAGELHRREAQLCRGKAHRRRRARDGGAHRGQRLPAVPGRRGAHHRGQRRACHQQALAGPGHGLARRRRQSAARRAARAGGLPERAAGAHLHHQPVGQGQAGAGARHRAAARPGLSASPTASRTPRWTTSIPQLRLRRR